MVNKLCQAATDGNDIVDKNFTVVIHIPDCQGVFLSPLDVNTKFFVIAVQSGNNMYLFTCGNVTVGNQKIVCSNGNE